MAMTALELAQQLVRFDSTSSRSNVPVTECVEGCLQGLGFETERVDYIDSRGVPKANVIGKRGQGLGGLAYFGHTDVVPANPWFSDAFGPFEPTVRNGKLYGRGSCDMKGSVACMLAAISRLAADRLARPLYVVCTADEEVGFRGATQVRDRSRLFRDMVAGQCHGIIGEPTRLEVVHAHKGTRVFTATSHGRAAHSSTNGGLNANWAMIPFLVEMRAIHEELERDPTWQNFEFDPPTVSWNLGINDHTAAVNITAPQSVCTVCFRPMPGQNAELLIERARAAAGRHGLEFCSDWKGEPVYVSPTAPIIQDALEVAGQARSRTVAYGTDGTMFTEIKNLFVFGPGDIAQAHTHDEWIALDQLERGTDLYLRLIERWCQ